MRRIFGRGNFSYFPPTFVLPAEAKQLRAAEARGEGPYMHKADNKMGGKGINLLERVSVEHLRCVHSARPDPTRGAGRRADAHSVA